METNQLHSRIISVVSGKGGVGKTAFTLSLAQELNDAGNRVVLIDADFSNRGLSEIMYDSTTKSERYLPAKDDPFSIGHNTCNRISLERVNDSMDFLRVPPLPSNTLADFESLSPRDLKKKLLTLVNTALDLTTANVAIVDCHGSRDVVSYAFASISSDVFVVNVPETITFFGTKRFLDDFRLFADELEEDSAVDTSEKPKFHMVFNLVPHGFRYKTLNSWYKQYFRKYCATDNLALLIPFDPRTSIATSIDPFPTRILHYSSMSEKIRMLVFNCFGQDSGLKVSYEARLISRYIGPFIRGCRPFLFSIIDETIPLRIFIGVVVLVFSSLMFTMLSGLSFNEIAKFLEDRSVISGIIGIYFGIVLVGSWLIYAFVVQRMIEFDTEVSGLVRFLGTGVVGRMEHWRIGFGTVCILLGLSVYAAHEFSLAEMAVSLDELRQHESVRGEDSEDMFMIRFVSAMVLVERVIGRVIFGAFALVFLVRGLRNVFFRLASGETVFRLTLMAGSLGWIFLYSLLVQNVKSW